MADFGASDRHAAWAMLVPWVDMALLSAATVFFAFATAKSPGQRADLPQEPFADGVRTQYSFVVRSLQQRSGSSGGSGGASAAVFFRDGRYPLGSRAEEEAFLRAAAEAISSETPEGRVALAYADGGLQHRDAMRFCTLLRQAGFTSVCFAASPDDGADGAEGAR